MNSNNNDFIYLPVSLGEAIDKLTILDVKLEKIKDNRKNDVKQEYDLLYDKLKEYIIKYNDLYQSMKKVNVLIWNMMDTLRDGNNITSDEYLKVCKECIEYNDIRFRVKNKINYISESLLKEQKSYKVNRLMIEINNNIENITDFIKPIKYYSFFYDEINIIYNDYNDLSTVLKDEFKYDPTIIFENESIHQNLKEYKKQFIFLNNFYEKNDIFLNFELNDDIINKILHE